MKFDPISNSLVGKLEKQTQLGTLDNKFGSRDKLDSQTFIDGLIDLSPDSKTGAIFEQEVYNQRSWLVDCNPDAYTTTTPINRALLTGTVAQFRNPAKKTWVVAGIRGTETFICKSLDDGKTWTKVYTVTSVYGSPDDIVTVINVENSYFVVFKDKILCSKNIVTDAFYVLYTAAAAFRIMNFKYLNGYYILMTNKSVIAYTTDLVTWKDGFLGGLERNGRPYSVMDIDYDASLDEYIAVLSEHRNATPILTGTFGNITPPNTNAGMIEKIANTNCWIIRFKTFLTDSLAFTDIPIGITTDSAYNQYNLAYRGFRIGNKYIISTFKGIIIYTDGCAIAPIKTLNTGVEFVSNLFKYKDYYCALIHVPWNGTELTMSCYNTHLAISKDLDTWRLFKSVFISEIAFDDAPLNKYMVTGGFLNQASPIDMTVPFQAVTTSGSMFTIDIPETNKLPMFSEPTLMECSYAGNLPAGAIARKDDTIIVSWGSSPVNSRPEYMLSEDGGITFIDIKLPTSITTGLVDNVGISDIIVHDGKFIATLVHYIGFGYSKILSSVDGKTWTIERVNTDKWAEQLNIIDGKVVSAARGGNNTNTVNIDILQRDSSGNWTVQTTLVNVSPNITLISKLIKTSQGKYMFSWGGKVWIAPAINGTYTPVLMASNNIGASVTPIIEYKGILFCSYMINTLGPLYFASTDNGVTWSTKSIYDCYKEYSVGSTTAAYISNMFIKDDVLYFMLQSGMVLFSTDGINFGYRSPPFVNVDEKNTWAAYVDPVTNDLIIGAPGFAIRYLDKKMTPFDFFMKHWNIYGYEEVSATGAGEINGSNPSLTTEMYINDIAWHPITRDKYSDSDNVFLNDDAIGIGAIGSTPTNMNTHGTIIDDYIYYAGQNVGGEYPIVQFKNKNSDVCIVPLDATQISYTSKPISFPSNNQICVIGMAPGNPNGTMRIAYSQHPLQSFTYVNFDAWAAANMGNSVVAASPFAAVYFAGGLIVVTPSNKLIFIDSLTSSAGWKIIIDLNTLIPDAKNNHISFAAPFVFNNNVYIYTRWNNEVGYSPVQTGDIYSTFKLDRNLNLTRVKRGSWCPTFNGQTVPIVAQMPSSFYMKPIGNKLFRFGRYHSDITYQEGNLILPLSGRCYPVSVFDSQIFPANSTIDTSFDGTVITLKTGNKLYQARQPKLANASFELVEITNNNPVMVAPNDVTFTGNKKFIVFFDPQGKIKRIPRTSGWDTNPELIMTTVADDTGFSVDPKVPAVYGASNDSASDYVLLSYTPKGTLQANLFIIGPTTIKLVQLTKEDATAAISDFCVVGNDAYISTSIILYKITNFATSASVSVELRASDTALDSFESLEWFSSQSKLVITGRDKTTYHPNVLLYDPVSKAKSTSGNIISLSSFNSWEAFVDANWIYVVGTSNDNCIYKTKDNIIFYPVNMHPTHNAEKLHNGAGAVTNRYLVNQAVFIPRLSIYDKLTGNIQYLPRTEYANGFPVTLADDLFLFSDLSGAIRLLRKYKKTYRPISVHDPVMVDNVSNDLKLLGNMPFATFSNAYSKLFYVNNTYILAVNNTNILYYSYDLQTWEKVYVPIPNGRTALAIASNYSGVNSPIAYSDEFGWIICGMTGDPVVTALTISYGFSLNALATRQISPIIANTSFVGNSVQVNSRGIYISTVYALYFIESPVANAEIIYDNTNYTSVANLNFPERHYIMPVDQRKLIDGDNLRCHIINASQTTGKTVNYTIVHKAGISSKTIAT